MKQSFPIFIINLPIEKDRREFMEKQLNNLGANYEFVEGIYGDDERVKNIYDESLAIKEHGKPLIFGEKGVARAHSILYERIIKENIPYSVILENDMVLPNNFISIVEKEIQKENKKWDWLSFDYRFVGLPFLSNWLLANYLTIKKKPLFFFYALIKSPYMITLSLFEGVRDLVARKISFYRGAKRFYRPLYNAGAYVITLAGAKKLLRFIKPMRLTADQVPNTARFKTDFRLFGYVPLVTHQDFVKFGTNAGKTDKEWEATVRG